MDSRFELISWPRLHTALLKIFESHEEKKDQNFLPLHFFFKTWNGIKIKNIFAEKAENLFSLRLRMRKRQGK